MQIIKPILVICFLIFLVSAFRHRGRVGLRAGSRLLALALGVAAIIAVIDPDIPQTIAAALGVARGTDLILYTSVVVFALTTLGLYFQVREVNVRLQLLARRVALSDAVLSGGPPGRRHRSSPAVKADGPSLDEFGATEPTARQQEVLERISIEQTSAERLDKGLAP